MLNAAEYVNWVRVAALLSAGFCMGFGSLGPSLGQGFIGGKACESVGKQPNSANSVNKTMFIALFFAETSSVYCLLISLLLLFVFKG